MTDEMKTFLGFYLDDVDYAQVRASIREFEKTPDYDRYFPQHIDDILWSMSCRKDLDPIEATKSAFILGIIMAKWAVDHDCYNKDYHLKVN